MSFGQKVNRNSLKTAFHSAKSFIGNAYNQTKNFLGDVDNGFKMAKKYIVLYLQCWIK